MPDAPAGSFADLLRSLMGDTAYSDLTERLTDPVNYRTCRRDAVAWLADVIGAEAFVEAAVEVGVLVQATDGTVGAPYWFADGEVVMADEYDPDRSHYSEPIYRIGGMS